MYLCHCPKIQDSLRYFIEIAYNGKNYHGWQLQEDAVTVQEVLEKSLSTLLKNVIKVTGAGRTDAGVHAKQLFAHFDFREIEDVLDLVFKLNSFLPKDISVKNIYKMKDDAMSKNKEDSFILDSLTNVGKIISINIKIEDSAKAQELLRTMYGHNIDTFGVSVQSWGFSDIMGEQKAMIEDAKALAREYNESLNAILNRNEL